MIASDDRRHGKIAGYVAGCGCPPCRTAKSRYEKRREYEAAHGQRRLTPSLGAQRRIRALMAIGWTCELIGEAVGMSRASVRNVLWRDQLRTATHQRIAAAYDQLSMTVGPSEVCRQRAAAAGWAAPLAWDDESIDDPGAGPYRPTVRTEVAGRRQVDEVLVQRALAGQPVHATFWERKAITERWLAAGRSTKSLEAVQGWSVRTGKSRRHNDQEAS